MKKVRFESPIKSVNISMDECHSPRPFIENKHLLFLTQGYQTNIRKYEDPVERYDASNSSPSPILPFPLQTKTNVKSSCAPSTELELSILDPSDKNTGHDSGPSPLFKSPRQASEFRYYSQQGVSDPNFNDKEICNYQQTLLNKNDSFFIRPQNTLDNVNLLQVRKMVPGHENVLRQKQDFNLANYHKQIPNVNYSKNISPYCTNHRIPLSEKENRSPKAVCNLQHPCCNCNSCGSPSGCGIGHCHMMQVPSHKSCQHSPCPCGVVTSKPHNTNQSEVECNPDTNNNNKSPIIKNAVDKKTWCVEKYARSKKGQDPVEQNKIDNIKNDVEPTVSDLIQIIKLQNEQIKLLQDKVDKVISNTEQNVLPNIPIQYRTEQVNVQTVDNDHHKISIGVMTSFEVVRTSAFINKEYSKQQNAQVQCNTSQILIKEVLSKSNPVIEQQFLKGINPQDIIQDYNDKNVIDNNHTRNTSNEDKTVNDLSLCNLIIDNPITPQLSPDQSIYLDLRDYSDSEDDNTAVGWTYYNKVMSHVNGLLQDSEIPTSAAAMQHNNPGPNLQMQIDRSNVSITKRVTFGEDIRVHHPGVPATSTDTSMRMNQLAMKYLKHNPPQRADHVYPMTKPHPTVDMSFATRKYMERHQLLQAEPTTSRSPPVPTRSPVPIPKFLDITALKNQPKLL